jgi:ribosome-associated protein
MDGVHDITRSVHIPEGELNFRFSRSSGPGGQNVNKRETQVELVFDVANSPSLSPPQRERVMQKLASRIDSQGLLHVVASEQRTQGRNRDIAVERFCELVREALKPDPPKRRPSRPGPAARERRLREKRARGDQKRQRTRRDDD